MRGLDRIFRFRTSVQAVKSIFNPKSLFATGAPGLWYDLSLTDGTLFQDAAGTTPVTAVEQPVGLVLDKSKGLVLGPELVTNGGFSNGTTGWTLYKQDAGGSESAAVVSDALQITFPRTSLSTYCQFTCDAFTTVVGKTYRVQANSPVCVRGTSDFYGVRKTDTVLPGSNMVSIVGADRGVAFGNGVGYFTATSTSTRIVLQVNRPTSNTDVVISFDNISVREITGNHAYQTTSANRPVLSARYNRLTKTEQFDDAVWVKANATVRQNVSVAPNGTTTADALIDNANNTEHFVYFNTSTAKANESSIVSFRVKKGTKSWVRVAALNASFGSYPSVKVWFNVDTGQKGTSSVVDATCVLENYAISSIGSGWHLCTMQYKFTANSGGTPNISIMAAASDGGQAYVGDGSEAIYIWGADLRPANDGVGLPPYQRVNTATDYDTVGFPLYLRFNGSTQFLQTNSIDFTSTDKVLVAAGVRKLSDSTAATVAELSANSGVTPNTFAVFAPGAVAPNYAFRSSGTSDSVATATTFASPVTNVLVGLGEVASDTAILRINGNQAASSTADQGTGNLGQHPLYIGARAGTGLFFNGRLYSLIIAGIKPTDAQVLGVETYINSLTRAF